MSLRHILYSLLLHLAAAALLIVSIDIAPRPITVPPPSADVVNAVTVDSKQVDAELNRLKDLEQQKQQQEQKRLKDLQDKARQAQQQRKAEEQRLAAVQKKKQEEEKQRVQEQQRLATLKKQQAVAEQQRQAEEEKKRQAEAERKRAEEAKRKAEEESKRLAEAKRKAEEEQKRKAAEEALQKQLAEEQAQRDAEQKQQDQKTVDLYGERIKRAIRQEFNTVGLPEGLSCVFMIRMIPGGQVVESQIVKSSGNSVFDRRAETALSKAAPLPVPDDPRVFEKMREIRIEFAPQE